MPSHVAFFTECYEPLVNGVVASVRDLRAELMRCGFPSWCITPQLRGTPAGWSKSDSHLYRIPSLPLPSASGYRLARPWLGKAVRARLAARVSLIHAHSLFTTGRLAHMTARELKIPFIWTYHTRLEHYAHYMPFSSAFARAILTQLTLRFAHKADAVLVPTQVIADYLRNIGVTNRLIIVPSGIETERFAKQPFNPDLRRRLKIPASQAVVLCVARLGKEKNLRTLLKAWSRIADPPALWLIGDGPERPALQLLARQLGIADHVHLLGKIAPSALPQWYAGADAFVFPSISETQGLVLVEALAAGLPIVAVDTPTNREVLRGSDALFARNDPGCFAHAVERCLAALSTGVAELAAAPSRRILAKRFDLRHCVNVTLRTYEELIERARYARGG